MKKACPQCGDATILKKPRRKGAKKFLSFIMCLAGITVIAGFCLNIVGSTYKDPFKYKEEFYNGDFTNIEKFCPEEYWEFISQGAGKTVDETVESTRQEQEAAASESAKKLQKNYGDNVTVEIENIEKAGILEDDTLRDLKAKLSDNYGIDKKQVKSGIVVTFDRVISGDGGSKTVNTTVTVVKIGRKWYITNKNGVLGKFLKYSK